MGRRMLCAAVAAVVSAMLLGGCGKFVKPDIEKGYSTTTAMSAVEYTIFMSEETAVAENVLATRMSAARSVADGSYSASDELENVREAISKVESLITAVTTTMPAQGYESDRQGLLNRLDDVRILLEKYETALKSGDNDALETCADEMQALCVAVSGEANVIYE